MIQGRDPGDENDAKGYEQGDVCVPWSYVDTDEDRADDPPRYDTVEDQRPIAERG